MPNDPNDFIITLRPDATPEQEEQLLNALAFVLLAIARSLAENDEAASLASDLPSTEE
jgi:hypothetical protein